MARGKEQNREFERYPKYRQLYLIAFEKMLANNKERGIVSKRHWETAEDVMTWWTSETRNDNPNEITIEDI